MTAAFSPLILTAELDRASFEWFDVLRREHFPPERNVVPAHLTLFHALAGDALERIADTLGETAASTPVIEAEVSGVRFLGRGVAFDIRSPKLIGVRAALAQQWADQLTPQDRAAYRPHVTIQNKVEPERARALHHKLQHEFRPFEVRIPGLLLWRYLGGPWGAEGRFALHGDADQRS